MNALTESSVLIWKLQEHFYFFLGGWKIQAPHLKQQGVLQYQSTNVYF